MKTTWLKTMVVAAALSVSGCGDDGGGSTGSGSGSGSDVNVQDGVGFSGEDASPAPTDTTGTGTGTGSQDTAGGGGPQDTVGSQDTGGGGGVDAGGGGADSTTGTDAPGGGPGTITLTGGVVLSEVESEFLDVASATARFTDAPADEAGTPHGACVVGPSSLGGGATAYGFDAGTLTVSGTSPAVTLTPNAEGSNGTGYSSSLPEGAETLLPPGGSLVTISAAGGAELGAFEMYLQMPEPVTMASPSTGIFSSASLDSDMVVAWNAGNGDQVIVTVSPLSSSYQPEAGDAVLCVLDSDTGSVTVPASALQAVGSGNAAVTVTRLKQSTAEVPGYVVPSVATRSTGGPISLD